MADALSKEHHPLVRLLVADLVGALIVKGVLNSTIRLPLQRSQQGLAAAAAAAAAAVGV